MFQYVERLDRHPERLSHRTPLPPQVADLDDEFAELLLTDFSDNFDAIPSTKVSVLLC